MRPRLPEELRSAPFSVRCFLAVSCLVITGLHAFNATLIFDDPGLYEHFRKLMSQGSLLHTLQVLFFNLDLHEWISEYRTYGVSKVLHFALWNLWGATPWPYGALIGLAQAASGVLLFVFARRIGAWPRQAVLVTAAWMFSPFLVTACFHHYAYLLLPVQVSLVTTYLVHARLRSGGRPFGLLAVGGFVIALTGEAHLPLSFAMLAMAIFGTPSPCTPRQRIALLGTLAATIVACIAAHRFAWSTLGVVAKRQRFEVAPRGDDVFLNRSIDYLQSLPAGFMEQVAQILRFDSLSRIAFVVTFVLSWIALRRFSRASSAADPTGLVEPPADALAMRRRALCVILGCTVLVLASFLVSWTGAVVFGSTGRTAGMTPALPRRYGYIPYTLVVMALLAMASEPWVRARLRPDPANVLLGALLGLWVALVAVCIPTVRYQDAQIWSQIRAAAAQKTDPQLLFVNAWNPARTEGYRSNHDTPGLRGPGFPILFESPLMSFWWQSLYASSRTPVSFAGDWYGKGADDGRLRLAGMVRGVHFVKLAPVEVAKSSVVVVADPRTAPHRWNEAPTQVQVFSRWEDFMASPSGMGMKIERGWEAQLAGGAAGQMAIDLGQAGASGSAGTLPDKSWSAPAIAGDLIVNHGIEEGQDAVYAPAPSMGGPLSYYETNRHGTFTYRIDFAGRGPKTIALDFRDTWAQAPGFRKMKLEIGLDDRWIGTQEIDVFALARNDVVTLKFPIADARTLRLRMSKASAASDIPFIVGIRVIPTTDAPDPVP